jgi:hypothetical protein
MKKPSVALLKQAIKEIIEYYDERRAVERLIQFGVMLKRTTTVSASNKKKIQEALYMYSPYRNFIKQNPDVEQIAKEKEVEGEIRGEIKGKVNSILKILTFRFPNDMLIDLAKQALGDIQDIQVLEQLESEALSSPDKQDIHEQLNKYLPKNKTESTVDGEPESSTESEAESEAE